MRRGSRPTSRPTRDEGKTLDTRLFVVEHTCSDWQLYWINICSLGSPPEIHTIDRIVYRVFSLAEFKVLVSQQL